MLRRRLSKIRCVALSMVLLTLGQPNLRAVSAQAKVPARYRPLYAELETKLSEIDRYVASRWDGKRGDVTFSAELLAADSNRGEELLNERTFRGVVLNLDRLQALGVKGVSVAINYPILLPAFPRSAEYLAFYKRVAEEIRKRNVKMAVGAQTTFTEPAFSTLRVNYSGLTLEKYTQGKRQQVETIIKELRPDYLTIENEPGTQEMNTGLRFTVEAVTDVVNYVLKGLNRSSVMMGAGAGTWERLDYIKSLAENTSVDFLDIHVYPVQRDFVIDRMIQISRIAEAHRKRLMIGEAWLYKAAQWELAQPAAAAPKIFGRDAFSFWAPLDGKFIEVMVKLSHYLKVEFTSFFWMRYFYGYVEYDESKDALPPAALFNLANQAAAPNIVGNTLSPAGSTFKRLITSPK